MLLEGKRAIIYGATGAIGSHVARAYAGEGAIVHLVARTDAAVETISEELRRAGATAHACALDVLDRHAVQRHADGVAAGGGIDVCFNAISHDDVQGTPLVEMTPGDFLQPVTKAVAAHFNIATAVGRHMSSRRRGVILVMAGGRESIPRLGGSHVAWAALAGLCRQLAAELGERGVRVNWLLSPGSPDPDGAAPTDHAPPPGTVGLLPHHQPS